MLAHEQLLLFLAYPVTASVVSEKPDRTRQEVVNP